MTSRGYIVKEQTWVYGSYSETLGKHFIKTLPEQRMFEVHPRSIGFSHEIFDVNNGPIFASIKINGAYTLGGDEVLIRIPEIETQTHTGNNIPNGSYTEPIGVRIKEIIDDVVFDRGVIRLLSEEVPLVWNDTIWTIEGIQEAITITKFPWDEEGKEEIDSDISYLIEEAEVNTEEDLVNHLSGIRVISKQWDTEENKFTVSIEIVTELLENFRSKHSKKPSSIEFSEKTLNLIMSHSIINSLSNQQTDKEIEPVLKGILIKINNQLKLNQYILNE